ncbi:hypothetical protein MNBD_GAMMA18-1993 [hydrothermal vent metagenome]|uniref:T6SS Phospholipase effector Tle1-like catalytic domain-containing protein n=1 Tax=hydrothermal vent metagenome TaxID=652676 RepID=A0A3B1A8L0_9ZZZZ
MMKKLIFCFDGTGNEPEDAKQSRGLFGVGDPEDESISNVLKLHLLLGGDLQGRNVFPDQQSFYYPGVGTYGSWWDKLRNRALAPPEEDVGSIIKRAVSDIYNHYEAGDELFVFGFSRGAAIARRFVSILSSTLPALGITEDPKVRFMGVFDTVAAIKHPNLFNEKIKPASDVVFEDRFISPLIEEAVHLLSLDDRRIAFFPALMNQSLKHDNLQDARVEEIWFAGAHSDVGGSFRYDGLSDIALQFLMERMAAKKIGLAVLSPLDVNYRDLFDGPDELIAYEDVVVQPSHLGRSHAQNEKAGVKELMYDYRMPRVSVNDVPSVYPPIIHHSVLDRMADDRDYQSTATIKNRINPYTNQAVGVRIWFSAHDIRTFDSIDEARQAVNTKLHRLAVGEEYSFSVNSNVKYNPSRLLLTAGQKYRFTVDMKQRWFDGTIACGPDGWKAKEEIDNRLMRWGIKLKEGGRRVPDAAWFELIGTVNRSDQESFRLLKHTTKSSPYKCLQGGELFAFANDLNSKYGNNLGTIVLSVTRVS